MQSSRASLLKRTFCRSASAATLVAAISIFMVAQSGTTRAQEAAPTGGVANASTDDALATDLGLRGLKTRPANYFDPYIGLQEIVTDNVLQTQTGKITDAVTKLFLGTDLNVDKARYTFSFSGAVAVDSFAEEHDFNAITFTGEADGKYLVLPGLLSLEAAGSQLQGQDTAFGTETIYRNNAAGAYQVSTYYIGPHLTVAPANLFDLNAAVRWDQVYFHEGVATAGTTTIPPVTSIVQGIAIADTKDRIRNVELTIGTQDIKDDQGYLGWSSAANVALKVTPQISLVGTGGYDDIRQGATQLANEGTWAVGFSYKPSDALSLEFQGGRRYHADYWNGYLDWHIGRRVYLNAGYVESLEPGAVLISTGFSDYISEINSDLPEPSSPTTTYGLTGNAVSPDSLNRTAHVNFTVNTDLQTFQLYAYNLSQTFLNPTTTNNVFGVSAIAAQAIGADMKLSLEGDYTIDRGGAGFAATAVNGTVGKDLRVRIQLSRDMNHLTNIAFFVQGERFLSPGGTGSNYTEFMASVAIVRHFR